MDDKYLTFKVKDEEGKEITCEEVYTFKNEQTNKTYMVYTDNTFDEDGALKLYAGIYNPDSLDKKIIPITDDKEWAFVSEMVETLEEENED